MGEICYKNNQKEWHPCENWEDADPVIQNLVKKLLSDLNVLRKRNMKMILKIKLKRNELYSNKDINRIMALIKKEIQKKMQSVKSEEKFYKLTTSISIRIYKGD